MKEVFTMWRDARMVMFVVVIAAVYAAFLIPFKGLVIVPGFTTVRPANVLPIVLSLLFGPAAAWGSAFGNLFADAFGGTLTWGSAFGFVGNFFYGFVAYRLWGNLGALSSGEEPDMRSLRQLVEYLIVALVAAAGTGAIIGWGLDVLGLLPFSVLATIITVNNFLPAAVLGPPLLYLLYPRIKNAGALYPDLVGKDLPSVSSPRQRAAAYGLTTIAVGWLLFGIAISVGLQGVRFGVIPAEVAVQASGSPLQIVVGAVSFLAILGFSAISGERLSSMVLREQSRAADEVIDDAFAFDGPDG